MLSINLRHKILIIGGNGLVGSTLAKYASLQHDIHLTVNHDYSSHKVIPHTKIDLLYDEAVSRKHCKIIYLYGHYWIIDLSSSNGTKINDKYIPFNILIKLNNYDIINLGITSFRINYIYPLKAKKILSFSA